MDGVMGVRRCATTTTTAAPRQTVPRRLTAMKKIRIAAPFEVVDDPEPRRFDILDYAQSAGDGLSFLIVHKWLNRKKAKDRKAIGKAIRRMIEIAAKGHRTSDDDYTDAAEVLDPFDYVVTRRFLRAAYRFAR